jgi:hypothetical protein
LENATIRTISFPRQRIWLELNIISVVILIRGRKIAAWRLISIVGI